MAEVPGAIVIAFGRCPATSGNVDAMNLFTSSVSAKIPHAGEFLHGIATDHSGNIYVGDTDTGVIKVYSSSGAFIKDFTTVTHAGSHSMEGMTLDDSGNLYVTQATSWTVLKYSSSGTLLAGSVITDGRVMV